MGMADFYSIGDDPESRRNALERFVRHVREGVPVPNHVQEFIADGIEKHLAGDNNPWLGKPGGRPKAQRDEWKAWAAWFAAYCDPDFRSLPLSDGGRFAEVGLLLSMSERQARRLSEKFSKSPRAADGLLVVFHGPKYARAKGLKCTPELLDILHGYHRAESLRRWELALADRNPG